jgi:hypothetical protein
MVLSGVGENVRASALADGVEYPEDAPPPLRNRPRESP